MCNLVVKKNIKDYVGISLISFAILILEIVLTKIFSVTLWYHFSYFVISLAMFGIGFGGILVYVLEKPFQHSLQRNVYFLSIALAVSIVFSLAAAVTYRLPKLLLWSALPGVLRTYLLCTAPFVFFSMIISLFFLNRPNKSNLIYSFDLQGAALACIACVLLISYLSAQQVIIIASICSALAALLFLWPRIKISSLLLFLGLIGLFFYSNCLFKVIYSKNDKEFFNQKLYEKWSPLSRITVFPKVVLSKKFEKSPFGWGMSSQYHLVPNRDYNQLWIEQDASAGTPIVPFDGDYQKVDFLKYDITSMPYYLKDKAEVFILGVGGGRDVLTALAFNSKRIDGVDIHPLMVDLVKNVFADYAGHIYENKKVHIAVSEGRSFLAMNKKSYDLIQIPLIDSWAATVAGAFAMSENSIYTQEAFGTFLKFLRPSGLLSVSRFYFDPDNQTIKVAILARVALEKEGVTAPKNHIIVVKSNQNADRAVVATVLIKKSEFTVQEMRKIKEIAKKMDFEMVYVPGDLSNEPLYEKALTLKNVRPFLDANYYDIRPNTDDRPFFFQMFYFSKIKDFFGKKPITGQIFNFYAVAIVLILLVISTVLLGLFYILPLVCVKNTPRPPLTWSLYFTLLGLGFMLIEIPFLQLTSVYLGGSMYGLSVGLFCLLFFGGIGNLLCYKVTDRQLKTLLMASLIIITIAAWILPLGLHRLIDYGFGYAWPIKVLLIALMLLPVATCMGLALPSGLRLIKDRYSQSIPWFWALNGAASVLGSILSMALSMIWGYQMSFVLASLLYFCAFLQGLLTNSWEPLRS